MTMDVATAKNSLFVLVGCLLAMMASNFSVDSFSSVAANTKTRNQWRRTAFESSTTIAFQLPMSSSTNTDESASTSTPIVALNVVLRIKPEVRDKFLEVILQNQKGTLDKDLEPLALEYTFGEDADEENTFHFHEKYIGEEGIKAHNAAPHFLVWEEFASTNPFTAPPEVYKFTIYKNDKK